MADDLTGSERLVGTARRKSSGERSALHRRSSVPAAYGATQRRANANSNGMQSVAITPLRSATSSVSSQRVTLSWHGVHVRTNNGNKLECCRLPCSHNKPYQTKQKHILRDAFGCAEPGQLLAIMGSSGAGKTTLLNVLTQRNLGDLEVAGHVRVNGEAVSRRSIRLMSAYVQQDDLFVETLTVREQLQFYALLRMGRDFTEEERGERVEEIIRELNLTKCADTLIGSPSGKRGISGGERKRLAFASELLTNPSLLFCDEPTSGLDSFMAYSVMSVLKAEAALGKTIVATIHQPSSQVFELFDIVYLMAEGRVAYAGPPDLAISFFQKIGFPSPGNFNPADHYIRTLAVVPRRERECRKRIRQICNAYEATDVGNKMKSRACLNHWDSGSTGAGSNSPYDIAVDQQKLQDVRYKASWYQQLNALLWRSSLNVIREPLLLRVRLFQAILVSLITGIVYVGQPTTGAAFVQNINGVLFQITVNMSMSFVFGVVDTFTKELPIFLREHSSGIYRVDSYFVAKIISELPIYLLLPAVFAVILYWMAGLYADFTTFIINVAISILTANVGISWGYAVSAATADVNVGLAVLPFIVIPFMLFGGFFINDATIPIYFVWLKYLSYFKYSFEALAINQWRNIDVIEGCLNSTCPSTGNKVLQSLSFKPTNLYVDVVVMLVMVFVIRFFGYLFLLIRTTVKK